MARQKHTTKDIIRLLRGAALTLAASLLLLALGAADVVGGESAPMQQLPDKERTSLERAYATAPWSAVLESGSPKQEGVVLEVFRAQAIAGALRTQGGRSSLTISNGVDTVTGTLQPAEVFTVERRWPGALVVGRWWSRVEAGFEFARVLDRAVVLPVTTWKSPIDLLLRVGSTRAAPELSAAIGTSSVTGAPGYLEPLLGGAQCVALVDSTLIRFAVGDGAFLDVDRQTALPLRCEYRRADGPPETTLRRADETRHPPEWWQALAVAHCSPDEHSVPPPVARQARILVLAQAMEGIGAVMNSFSWTELRLLASQTCAAVFFCAEMRAVMKVAADDFRRRYDEKRSQASGLAEPERTRGLRRLRDSLTEEFRSWYLAAMQEEIGDASGVHRASGASGAKEGPLSFARLLDEAARRLAGSLTSDYPLGTTDAR